MRGANANTNARAKPTRSPRSALAFSIGQILCWLAAFGSLVTYVPQAERRAMFEVLAIAVAALVLLALSWRRLPRLVRLLVVVLDLPVAGFAIWMATTRLL